MFKNTNADEENPTVSKDGRWSLKISKATLEDGGKEFNAKPVTAYLESGQQSIIFPENGVMKSNDKFTEIP